MAYTLETLRGQNAHSIYGRRLSVTHDDFVAGPKGVLTAIEDINVGNVGSSITNYGMTRITSAVNLGTTLAGVGYTLQAPRPGARKTIYHYGASTSAHVFGITGGTVVGGSLTSAGSTMISTFRGGAIVELIGLSTSQWAVMQASSASVNSSAQYGISYTATISS